MTPAALETKAFSAWKAPSDGQEVPLHPPTGAGRASDGAVECKPNVTGAERKDMEIPRPSACVQGLCPARGTSKELVASPFTEGMSKARDVR